MRNQTRNVSQNKLSSSSLLSRSISLPGKIVNPLRDWNILIIIFIFFIIISVGFDFYMYRQIVNDEMYVGVKREELVIENLKSDDLQKILTNFEGKKANMTNLKPQNLVDPSI